MDASPLPAAPTLKAGMETGPRGQGGAIRACERELGVGRLQAGGGLMGPPGRSGHSTWDPGPLRPELLTVGFLHEAGNTAEAAEPSWGLQPTPRLMAAPVSCHQGSAHLSFSSTAPLSSIPRPPGAVLPLLARPHTSENREARDPGLGGRSGLADPPSSLLHGRWGSLTRSCIMAS